MKSDFATDHLRKRVIAFVMAVLLALTPVLSDIGGAGGVKADGSGDKPIYEINVETFLSQDESKTVYVDLSVQTVKLSSNDAGYIFEYTDGDGENLRDNPVCITATDAGTKRIGYAVDRSSATDYAHITIVDVSAFTDEDLVVKGKSERTDSEASALSADSGTPVALEGTISLTAGDKRYGGNANSETKAESSVSAGVIKYAVAETPASDSAQRLADLSWSTDAEAVANSATDKSDDKTGTEYTFYAAYFAKSSNANDEDGTLVKDTCKTFTVNVVGDNAGPTVTDVKTTVGGTELTGNTTLNNTYYAISDSVNLSVEFSATDSNMPTEEPYGIYIESSADNKNWTSLSGSVVYNDSVKYTATVSGISPTEGTTYYHIKAVDKYGNESITQLYSIAKYIAKNELSVSDKSDSTGNDLVEENLTGVSSSKKTIYVSGVFSSKPTAIKVVDKNSAPLATEQLSGLSEVGGYYTISSKAITLPAVDNNINMENITVQVLGEATTGESPILASASIGTIGYDTTSPVITFEPEDTDGENSTTYLTPSENGNIVWQNAETAKVVIKSGNSDDGVYESDLASASYSVNGASSSIDVGTGNTSVEKTVEVPESTSTSGTSVKFTAEDKAGNETTDKECTFYVDRTQPNNVSFTLSNDYYKTGERNSTTYYSKTVPTLDISAEDNIGIAKIVYKLEFSEDKTWEGSIDNISTVSEPTSYVTKYETSSTATDDKCKSISLSTLLGDNPENGTYNVTVTVYDLAGNSYTKVDQLVYDNTAPVIGSDPESGLKLESIVCLKEDENDWSEAGEAKLASVDGVDTLYVNTETDTNQYAYKLEVSDASGLPDDGWLTCSSDLITNIVYSGNTVYLVINKTKLNDTSAQTVSGIKLKDNLGNETSDDSKITLSKKVQAVSQKITFKAVLKVKGDDDKYTEITDLDSDAAKALAEGTNKTYAVTLKATSPNEIQQLYLTYGTDSTKKILPETDLKNEYDAATKLYTCEVTITLPINENLKFPSLKANCVDDTIATENTPETEPLITILYDKTAPKVSSVATNPDLTGTTSPKWVSSLTITPTIISGDGNVESDIVEAGYEIYNGETKVTGGLKTENLGDGDLTYDTNTKVTSVSSLSVTASKTTDGTTVTFWATDKAGNKLENETYTYYVDSEKPVLSAIKVNGEALSSDAAPLIKDPKISFTVSDNLTLADVSVKVTKDGTDVTRISNPIDTAGFASGETSKSYEKSLTDLVGKATGSTYAPDGVYTITITATDKAGNEAVAATITFTLDNTAPNTPTVTLQQYDGTNWVDYTSTYIDTDKHYSYRYKITGVGDTNLPDVVTEAVKVADGNIWSSSNSRTGALEKGTEDSYYTYAFDDTDKANIRNAGTSGYVNYVIVKDKSGNATYVECPALKALDTSIKFGTIELRDSDGNVKKFGDGNLAVDDTYKLYVSVESGYGILKDNVILSKNGDAADKSDFAVTLTSSFDEKKVRFTTSLVFDIPGTELSGAKSINELYKQLRLTVTDKGEYTASTDIGTLIYDNSRPYVSVLEYSDKAWVKAADATVTYEVVSGSQSVESVLSSASYTLAGKTVDITPSSGKTTTGRKTVTMPETVNPKSGTTITFAAEDNAGNTIGTLNGTKPKSLTMFVDGHNPSVTGLTVDGADSVSAPLTGVPKISTAFSDNLALGRVEVTVTYPDGTSKVYTKKYGESDGLGVDVTGSYSFKVDSTKDKAADGDYKVSVKAYDKAGNASSSKTLSFKVDNTKPVVGVAISGGTQGGKQPRKDGTDYYYRSDVQVSFMVEETNFTAEGVTVTDKLGTNEAQPVSVTWKKVNSRYVGTAVISAEGAHEVSIGATDKSGNAAAGRNITFCIDKTAPVVSLTLNGSTYNESQGVVYLTAGTSITAVVSDMTEDTGDLNVQIIEVKPDQAAGNPSYTKTSARSFSFADEADYTVNVYAVDMAGNISATRTVKFRVDAAAPELNITGATGGGTSASASTVTFTMNEAFWQDATASVNIYRKAGDGKEESLYKTITLTPTAYSSSVSESLTETGVYRFEFTASDQAGHKTETSQSYTIDREAPVVTLSGVNNYDITDENVQFAAQITDDFYSSKKVSLSGYVTDIDGKKTSIDFGAYNQSGNPTVINQEFASDGIYDIEVTSSDTAGNSQTGKVHFTIDKTAPEIGDLSAYEGTLKEFKWDIDLDELVTDLTVCETHMYLNGSEYDGVSDIEDGSYVLLITAEDEMGHTSEKEVSFVLDTKAPVFIVTGVEDGEVKNETYSIGVSLQLSEDTLKEVTLNGTAVDIVDNAAEITVDSKGDYTLTMSATDEAGNKASQEISFTYGEKTSNWWIWLVIVAGLLVLGFVIVVVVKKNNEENQA